MTSDMRQDGMERAYIERAREADPQTRSFDLDRPLRASRFRRHRRDGGTERRAVFARRRRFLRQAERHKGRGTPTGIPYGLTPPGLQQSPVDAPSPGQLGNVDLGLQALGDDRCLLLRTSTDAAGQSP